MLYSSEDEFDNQPLMQGFKNTGKGRSFGNSSASNKDDLPLIHAYRKQQEQEQKQKNSTQERMQKKKRSRDSETDINMLPNESDVLNAKRQRKEKHFQFSENSKKRRDDSRSTRLGDQVKRRKKNKRYIVFSDDEDEEHEIIPAANVLDNFGKDEEENIQYSESIQPIKKQKDVEEDPFEELLRENKIRAMAMIEKQDENIFYDKELEPLPTDFVDPEPEENGSALQRKIERYLPYKDFAFRVLSETDTEKFCENGKEAYFLIIWGKEVRKLLKDNGYDPNIFVWIDDEENKEGKERDIDEEEDNLDNFDELYYLILWRQNLIDELAPNHLRIPKLLFKKLFDEEELLRWEPTE